MHSLGFLFCWAHLTDPSSTLHVASLLLATSCMTLAYSHWYSKVCLCFDGFMNTTFQPSSFICSLQLESIWSTATFSLRRAQFVCYICPIVHRSYKYSMRHMVCSSRSLTKLNLSLLRRSWHTRQPHIRLALVRSRTRTFCQRFLAQCSASLHRAPVAPCCCWLARSVSVEKQLANWLIFAWISCGIKCNAGGDERFEHAMKRSKHTRARARVTRINIGRGRFFVVFFFTSSLSAFFHSLGLCLTGVCDRLMLWFSAIGSDLEHLSIVKEIKMRNYTESERQRGN